MYWELENRKLTVYATGLLGFQMLLQHIAE